MPPRPDLLPIPFDRHLLRHNLENRIADPRGRVPLDLHHAASNSASPVRPVDEWLPGPDLRPPPARRLEPQSTPSRPLWPRLGEVPPPATTSIEHRVRITARIEQSFIPGRIIDLLV